MINAVPQTSNTDGDENLELLGPLIAALIQFEPATERGGIADKSDLVSGVSAAHTPSEMLSWLDTVVKCPNFVSILLRAFTTNSASSSAGSALGLCAFSKWVIRELV